MGPPARTVGQRFSGGQAVQRPPAAGYSLADVSRSCLGALCVRRCRTRGIDANDNDDLLMDWLWSMLNTPTWAVSAHLPGFELPEGGQHRLDLAACEQAAQLCRDAFEAARPWMDAQSVTLAKTVVYEIDRRVLTLR